jgi:acetate kinase
MLASQCYTLTINGGSSSIKFALFNAQQSAESRLLNSLLKGKLTGIGSSRLRIDVEIQTETLDQSGIFNNGAPEHQDYSVDDHTFAPAVTELLNWIKTYIDTEQLLAVGHRVVHGGPSYASPQLITPTMLATLEQWAAIDPEHLPQEISLVKRFMQALPRVQHIACFDTDFHRHLPPVARLLAIPRRYLDKGIRRYGFHGLSYTFVLEELRRLEGAKRANGRVVIAHLGSGASLTATHEGKSVDTSMGLTPTSGIPMSSRSGDLDPGLYAYLAQTEQMSVKAFQHMVNHESGLLGISEISPDIRELLKCEHDDYRAAEAIALFCYQTKKWICALAGALGGVDTLIFTGGIGENLPTIRARICAGIEFIGIKLDASTNHSNADVISTTNSPVLVRVIPTNEEQVIAQQVYHVLEQTNSKHYKNHLTDNHH